MVAIIDYGVGNLFSLRSSLAAIGAESVVTGDADEITARRPRHSARRRGLRGRAAEARGVRPRERGVPLRGLGEAPARHLPGHAAALRAQLRIRRAPGPRPAARRGRRHGRAHTAGARHTPDRLERPAQNKGKPHPLRHGRGRARLLRAQLLRGALRRFASPRRRSTASS